ncbi:tetrahydromethanopterin S-methyltransferase subunit A [Methanothermobacter thermautotrophicus]|uniref:tetrahydromethanopterin S-methyltransferase subunit A n=1 Tax=Methanothermobacter thermautotrophicus TaxID=145262 RepID=UPI0022B971E6|nr:tetrahydromethanopterin S-methyltransferase subunit A [Methanothermobacter thermautotrophicus]WBF07410.1 tetrahydromethanopterin S-methyltransferase subunit A [Methanothermobacter thermautotrophicus]
MSEKKPVPEDWPHIVGDYVVGDEESPVAVVTLGSHMEDDPVKAGAAISGPLHTENLGIEKVVGNVIANPNLRFLIVCGAEVMGHITGQTMKALHSNGVDLETGRIIGATGAIPYIENMPEEAIERFRRQVELVDMVDVEDPDSIAARIQECVVHDSGAMEEEPLILKVPEIGKGDSEENT